MPPDKAYWDTYFHKWHSECQKLLFQGAARISLKNESLDYRKTDCSIRSSSIRHTDKLFRHRWMYEYSLRKLESAANFTHVGAFANLGNCVMESDLSDDVFDEDCSVKHNELFDDKKSVNHLWVFDIILFIRSNSWVRWIHSFRIIETRRETLNTNR